jgi:hypothetical protein
MKKLTEQEKLATEAALVLGTKEVAVEQPAPKPYNSIYVRLQSMVDARLLYDGRVSGEHYEWAKAGSVVAVDARDAPYLLEKRIKSQSCCSGSDNAVFQIAN